MKLYQTSILIASIVVLAYFVKIYILMFVVISAIVAFSSCLLNKHHSKGIVAVNIAILLFAFLILKNAQGYALPVGYSVFAFSAISLLVDQYRMHRCYSLLEILCFLFFFPKIFAGPIDRAEQFVVQVRTKKSFLVSNIYEPLKMCVYASLYKFVVADQLYMLCLDTYSGINEILCILCYGIAFFFDFYAYSIFAIAFGKALGVSLSENFNSPYTSNSFKDFWRRWNITLGLWLRDYIYIPLGGNKLSAIHSGIAVLVVFLVSSIWHNLTTPFLLWGLAHACLLIIERLFRIKGGRLYGLVVCAVSITLWQLFDVENVSEFITRLCSICTWNPIESRLIVGTIISAIALWFAERKATKNIIFIHSSSPRYILKEASLTCLMLIIVVLLSNSPSINFFYMKF